MSSFKNYRRSIILDFNYDQVKKGVPEANKQMALLNAEFRKQSESIATTGSSMDKVNIKHQALTQQVQIQTGKVNSLRKELETLEGAEKRNEKAIISKTIELKNAETQLIKFQNSLQETSNKLNQQSNVFTNLGQKIENFRSDIEKSGVDVEEMGKGLTDLGIAMTIGITAPLVAIGKSSVSTFTTFESAFAGVRKTVSATEEEFQVLAKSIREMSKTMPTSASEIASVVEIAGQLGVQKDALLGFSEVMINLGNTTNLSAGMAAESLAQFANITKMSQKDFDRLGSVIFKLDTNMATTAASMTDMATRMASAGKQVGMTEAEIFSLAAALASTGMEAQAGGTAISRVMVNMQLAVEKGGDDLKNFASVAGMTSGQFRKAFKEDAAGALISFIEGLGTMEDRGRSAIATLENMGITEVRVRDALLRAASAGDLFANAIALGTEEWEKNEALTKGAEERYKTFSSNLEIFKNKIKEIGVLIGGNITPVLSDILSIASPVLQAIAFALELFNKLPEPVRKVVIVLAMLMAVIGPFLTIIGSLLTRMNTMSRSVSNISTAFNGFMTVVNGLNSPLLKILGIFLLVAGALTAILILINALKKNGDQVGKITSDIAKAQQPLQDMQKQVNNIPSYAVKGSHRSGLGRVPYDGYIAELHQDEEVLRANDPRNRNNPRFNAANGGQTINVYVSADDLKQVSDVVRLFENLKQGSRQGV